MADARIPMSVVMEAFGVPATVTLPDADPIETTVVWTEPGGDLAPGGMNAPRIHSAARLLAIAKSDVPQLPLRTIIVAPEELDGEDLTWMVDGIERVEHDHVRAKVVRVEA